MTVPVWRLTASSPAMQGPPMAATGRSMPVRRFTSAATRSGSAVSFASSGCMPLVIMTTGTGAFSASHRRSMAQATPAELTPSTMRSVSRAEGRGEFLMVEGAARHPGA